MYRVIFSTGSTSSVTFPSMSFSPLSGVSRYFRRFPSYWYLTVNVCFTFVRCIAFFPRVPLLAMPFRQFQKIYTTRVLRGAHRSSRGGNEMGKGAEQWLSTILWNAVKPIAATATEPCWFDQKRHASLVSRRSVDDTCCGPWKGWLLEFVIRW